MDLPPDLGAALDRALSDVAPGDLARATQSLSGRYRGREGRGALVRSESDVASYLAYRLPATYAAIASALRAVRAGVPDRQPRSLLDVGAGPGTAAWAATSVWPEIDRTTLVERDARMIAAGKELAAAALHGGLRSGYWTQSDLRLGVPAEGAELVIAAYALGELHRREVWRVVDNLWDASGELLLLVEPGTPAGFGLIREVRAHLIGRGAHVAAPCPHDGECPMAGGDWCHFSTRVARSRRHRMAKGGSLGYEDEKYSYVALSRAPVVALGSRVLRHPQVRSGHIRLELCTPDGLEHRTVTRKDREAFREARHLSWGDVVNTRAAPEPGHESGHGQ